MNNQTPFELMIECPKTGQLVPIGKKVTLKELKHWTFVMEHITIQCPHCGQQHIASEEKACIRLP
jgi:transposase-like protein